MLRSGVKCERKTRRKVFIFLTRAATKSLKTADREQTAQLLRFVCVRVIILFN